MRKIKRQSVVCTVPNLPNSEISPNARKHHLGKNRLMQSAKDVMENALKEQGCLQNPLWESAHLDLLFRATDKRRRDLDNMVASCKPWIDALKNTVIVDDRASILATLSARYEIGEVEETVMTVTQQ
jgi:Holliday junction resolvase RusA-like endonuclease